MDVMKKRAFIIFFVFIVLSFYFFNAIVCPIQHCASVTYHGTDKSLDKQNELQKNYRMFKGTRRLISHAFNLSNRDVMVVLHIQKTGGTVFGRNLVQNLILERPCESRGDNIYECKRPASNQVWLYSRFSTGWVCGPHAGWTELASCIPHILRNKRSQTKLNRIFYITWLRNPVERFLSEFGHVRRGATWKSAKHICNGKQYNLPTCYKGTRWTNVTLQDFLNCPHNLAINRQTRMVANMSSIGCYNGDLFNSTERKRALLRNAKKNLRSFAFIGLLEYQKESQFLFESTFGLKFSRPFEQRTRQWGKNALLDITSKEYKRIRSVNRLDVQLYEYAKELFFERLRYFQTLSKKKSTLAFA